MTLGETIALCVIVVLGVLLFAYVSYKIWEQKNRRVCPMCRQKDGSRSIMDYSGREQDGVRQFWCPKCDYKTWLPEDNPKPNTPP